MKKSIIDRLTALETSIKDKFRDEKLQRPIAACLNALNESLPLNARQAAPLAQMVQRIKGGAPTPEDQAVLKALPNAELDVIGITALQFIEVALYLEETY